MFTGIIQDVGKLEAITHNGPSARVQIYSPHICQDAQPGDSICSNGVCLTVTDLSKVHFWADLSLETLNRTTFKDLYAGAEINLEPSLRPQDRMGGHIVSGHVDAVGEITGFDEEGESWKLTVRFPVDLARLIAEKGSFTIDGISLTVTTVGSDFASFAIVPFTIEHTNLRKAGVGTKVNLEIDMLARYVDRLMNFSHVSQSTGLNHEKLRHYGYIDR